MRSILLASLGLLVACNLGEGPAPTGGGGGGGAAGVDAPSGGGGGGGGGLDAPLAIDAGSGSGSGSAAVIEPGVCQNRQTTPNAPHIHTAGGGTNAGLECMSSGCHGQGGAGPQFMLAGTLYKTGGTVADPGGAMIEIQANGATVVNPNSPYTDTAGNFYVYAGTIPAAFPAKAWVTACPTVTPMTNAIVQGGGDCYTCHKTGAQGVITLQ